VEQTAPFYTVLELQTSEESPLVQVTILAMDRMRSLNMHVTFDPYYFEEDT